jgi:hypothetical protein
MAKIAFFSIYTCYLKNLVLILYIIIYKDINQLK